MPDDETPGICKKERWKLVKCMSFCTHSPMMASLALRCSDTLPLAISWHYVVGDCACLCPEASQCQRHCCQCNDKTACDSTKTLQRNYVRHFLSCRCYYSMTGESVESCRDTKLTDRFIAEWFSYILEIHIKNDNLLVWGDG